MSWGAVGSLRFVTDRHPRGFRTGGATAVFVALVLAVSACRSDDPYVPAGIMRTPAPDVSIVSLPDVTAGGADFAFRAADGGIFVMYFGYTSCPDICPTTMADLRSALRELGDDAERIEVGMATVDPLRDTDSVIAAYVHAFFPEGRAFRTEDDRALRAAADAFGAAFEVTFNDEGLEEVIHTAFLYAVDDAGRLRLTWPFGIESEDMARDLRALLQEETNA